MYRRTTRRTRGGRTALFVTLGTVGMATGGNLFSMARIPRYGYEPHTKKSTFGGSR
jgi:hypothetical protein